MRNIIEALVASGAIDADMAKMWVESSEKETKRKALLARAKQFPPGPDAIVDLALFYHAEGQEKECKKWISNGARLRDPYCMAQEAVYICRANRYVHTQAMYFMTQAAEAGHILSIYRLAKMFYCV